MDFKALIRPVGLLWFLRPPDRGQVEHCHRGMLGREVPPANGGLADLALSDSIGDGRQQGRQESMASSTSFWESEITLAQRVANPHISHRSASTSRPLSTAHSHRRKGDRSALVVARQGARPRAAPWHYVAPDSPGLQWMVQWE